MMSMLSYEGVECCFNGTLGWCEQALDEMYEHQIYDHKMMTMILIMMMMMIIMIVINPEGG